MAAGNKPLKKSENTSTPSVLRCLSCGQEFNSKDFYDSDSKLFESIGKIPYCKECLDKFYKMFLKEYQKLEYQNPERKAIERLCMALDLYYSNKIYDSAVKVSESIPTATLFALYLKQVKLYQCKWLLK